MRIKPYYKWVVLAGLISAAVPSGFAQAYVQAVADFDTMVREYNLISFGAANISGNDTWGGLAVQGNLTLTGVPVANDPNHILTSTATEPVLYVGGQLILNGDAHLNSGYASISSANNPGLTFSLGDRLEGSNGKLLLGANKSNPLTNAGPTAWNWASLGSQAVSLSNALANAAQNGAQTGLVAVNNQKLTFSSAGSSGAGVVVFTLDASQLSSQHFGSTYYDGVLFSVGSNQTAVVNVINANGTSFFGQGVNFNDPGIAGRLLWNFNGTGSVSLGNGDQFYGSILAPQMSLSNAYNTAINGQLVVGNLTSYTGAELHETAFSPVGVSGGTGVLVPEPSTYALWGAGLCAVGFILRRRLSRRMDVRH